VGSKGVQEADGVETYVKDIIVARLSDVLGENLKTVLDLARVYDELAEGLKARCREDFAKYGLELVDLFIGAITPPEEVQKVIDERSGMAAVGNMGAYMQFKAAKAMEEAAVNPSGSGAAAGMGLGMGAGMGMMVPGMLAQSMQQAGAGAAGAAAAQAACPTCHAANAAGAKFCQACGKPMAPPQAACPACNAPNPQGAKFCMGCGKPMAAGPAKCSKCNAENPPGAKFCGGCGAGL
jgi:membrane protease subunit (stomatin/prohibitin family)